MSFSTPRDGFLSGSNSTTLSLSSTQSYIGTYEEVSEYSMLKTIIILGGGESATLIIKHSDDGLGTNTFEESLLISTSKEHTINLKMAYVRLEVDADQGTAVNGIIQTHYHNNYTNTTSNVSDIIQPNTTIPTVKSIIAGECVGGELQNIRISPHRAIHTEIRSPLDSFGRVRTSNPFSLIDIKQYNDNAQFEMDTILEFNGTVANYTPGRPFTEMAVIGEFPGRVVRQTIKYPPYQPGKSLLYLITGSLADSSENGVISRIGCFDRKSDKTIDTISSGDGFFFQYEGTGSTLSLVYRTSNNSSFTEIDTVISQSSWNIDTLDGTGVSGVTINPLLRQIFVFQVEWLGTGTVTAGIFIDGSFVPCHSFDFANDSETIPYSTRGSLPVRYEIESAGIGSANVVNMNQICCSVQSEGGFDPFGRIYSASRGTSTSTTSTEIPIISLRLNQNDNTRPRTTMRLLDIVIACTSQDNSIYRVYKFLPSPLSNALTNENFQNYTDESGLLGSAAEYDISATSVDLTGTFPYTKIIEGYFANNQDQVNLNIKDKITINSNIEGYSELIVITVDPIAGSGTYLASITWQEFE